MLPGMDSDGAKKVLAAARDSAQLSQWQEIQHLLHEVYAQNLLTGADHGDAAYLLGLAAMGTGDWPGAKPLLTEASTSAGTQYRAEAKTRLTEISHHEAAVAAESDQDVDQKEAAAVLAAGADAMALGDYDAALAHYTAVYNGHADPNPRAKGALGIANILAHKDDLTQAKQYAEYAHGTGIADVVAEAKILLDWIAQQQAALTAAADGTTINEYNVTNEGAKSAFFNNDYLRARVLLTSLLNDPQLGAVERAKAALNLGMVEMRLGEYPEARLNVDMAVTHGSGATVEKAKRIAAILDRHDTAEALVEEFED
ncbi:MAG: hypothetical protein QOJ34_1936 [Pseudonocardiales bacterium]|jgi:tetratricopeptide (TPR) repeat protein|nr:hypothetical protein [Pseudonocardiales bacterium]